MCERRGVKERRSDGVESIEKGNSIEKYGNLEVPLEVGGRC
jgi:hypothetical protein